MSEADLPQILARVAPTRRITPEDALDIRRALFGDMAVSSLEAETLIALDEAAAERCDEWTMLFTEAVTDFLVRQQHPAGYVDDDGAAWLIGLIGKDGHIKTPTELDLLLHILEVADEVPQSLSDFALAQVKYAILTGDGVLVRAGRIQGGVIDAAEVEVLRRIVFAAGGEGNLGVTRHEAEALFDINDAVKGRDNHSGWADFFAKAVGASVMSVSPFHTPSREDAAHHEAWLNEPQTMAGFVGGMLRAPDVRGAVDDVFGQPAMDRAYADQLAHEDAELTAAAPVTADEAAWIYERIGHDGTFDPAEKALLRFLREEREQLGPSLEDLAEQADDDQPVVFGRRKSVG